MAEPSHKATLPMDLGTNPRPNSFVSTKAMLWHNAIIDDILAHPGSTQKAIAERLGKSPITIGYIVNSDLFKFQLAQRREQFTKDLDARLIGKLANVAEKALDLTLDRLEKVQTAVPLALLNDISNKSLDRLGYGPKAAPPSVQVNVQQNNTTQVAAPVSAEALRDARATLRTIEAVRVGETAVRSTPQAVLLAEGQDSQFAPEPSASLEDSVPRSGVAGDGEGSEGAL